MQYFLKTLSFLIKTSIFADLTNKILFTKTYFLWLLLID